MSKSEDTVVVKAGALALDILQAGFHFPIEDGIINVENIHDNIISSIYSKELGPLDNEVIELAISSVQDLVDTMKK